jgi:hypothetical protein
LLTSRSSVYELACEETFNSYEIFSSELVLVWVSENNFGKRCSSTWIMNDFLNYSLDVAK